MSTIEDIIPNDICSPIIIDIGCGIGKSLYAICKKCGSRSYIIGLDLDCLKLVKAKDLVQDIYVELICCDVTKLPIRNESITTITMILTLHEVEESLINELFKDLIRVLRINGILFIIDKVLEKFNTKSEELSVIVEEAYHKAKEYALGYRSWGIRRAKDIVNLVENFGFKLLDKNIIKFGKWLNGNEFLKHWGKETLQLCNMITDHRRKKELLNIIKRIKLIASKHGYGPLTLLIAIFNKVRNM